MPAHPDIDGEEIEGSVYQIVFHNEENGFSILKTQTSLTPELVTVVGVLPAVVEGEGFKATGQWQEDKKFGRQFKAQLIIPRPPDTVSAIEQYLSSGLIDGIGKRYAKRIVKKFGVDTFDVIENESLRLESVEGVGAKRRIRIKESWNEQKAVRDIMLFLHGNGLSPNRATRLFKEYGANAINILRKNPYQLVRDVAGVGFKTADDIARKMGQADDAPQRIAAGIHYELENCAGQGHCAMPREDLVSSASRTLSVDPELVKVGLAEEIKADRLADEMINGRELIYAFEYIAAENIVARKLSRLAKLPANYPDIEPDKAIDWFQETHELQLGEDQTTAVRGALLNRVFIITGGPGVGKTTILNAILQILVTKRVAPILSAPTGRASKRLNESTGREASTIHRLLEFQPAGGFARNQANPLQGDLFVVDEASMIDIKLMADFMKAFPEDAHLILVGDIDQLPSVGAGNVLRDLIESEQIPVVRLHQIFRQAENSQIVSVAHSINQGSLPEPDNDPDADFFFFERDGSTNVVQTLKELITNRIPKKFDLDIREDIQVLTPMNRNTLGTKSLNQELQQAINPPDHFKHEVERFGKTFRVGDKVIQTRNNYENEVFNGDIGLISEITADPTRVIVHFDAGREVAYDPGELDELQLAYAITIHKSQGSEFPAVIIPLAAEQYILLQRNLIYTGITRGKKLVVLVGEKRALEMAVNNQESYHRWTGLKHRLQSNATSGPIKDEDIDDAIELKSS